jgi:hypothetical protein
MNELIKKFQEKPHFEKHPEFVERHLSRYFKDGETSVFHEVVSFDFHLDVFFIKPKGRAYNMLVTCGMSTFAMTVDAEVESPEKHQFGELMVLLPKDIEFSMVHTGDEKNSWIISMLKRTARFPHHYDTYIGNGHTIQATEDLQPYSKETEFVGCAILPSATFDQAFTRIACGKNQINIYSLFPLYKNELKYKIKHGYKGLLDLLIKENAKEMIDLNRKNLIGSFWNLFKN